MWAVKNHKRGERLIWLYSLKHRLQVNEVLTNRHFCQLTADSKWDLVTRFGSVQCCKCVITWWFMTCSVKQRKCVPRLQSNYWCQHLLKITTTSRYKKSIYYRAIMLITNYQVGISFLKHFGTLNELLPFARSLICYLFHTADTNWNYVCWHCLMVIWHFS